MADLGNTIRRFMGWDARRAVSARRVPFRSAADSVEQVAPARARPFVEVTAEQYAADPTAVWAAVRSKLMAVPCLDHLRLTPKQRTAWLVVAYDGTVRREGHGRFFRVYGVGRAGEVVAALSEIEAFSAGQILDEAIGRDFRYLDDNETAIGGAGVPSMRLGKPPDYFDLDVMYLGMADAVVELLQQHMASHRQDFVSIDEAAQQGDEADER